jgi:2'-5' RNA ligase
MHDSYFPGGAGDRRLNRYAVIIFLPQHLEEVVAPIREKYDPAYNLVNAHVTLVFPFETNKPLDELVGAVRSVADRVQPITVELDSIGDFYPKSPMIYWSIRKNDGLGELYYSLYARLDLPLVHKQYVPHVTIAREISDFRLVLVKDKIASYLPREKFLATAVDLVTPLAGQRWVSVRTIPLAGLDYI